MEGSHYESAEQMGEEPRTPAGCAFGGLRATFWIVTGFTAYMVSTLLFLHGTRWLLPNVADEFEFLVGVAFMVIAGVITFRLARRSRDLPASVLVAGTVFQVGVYTGLFVLG